MNPGSGATGSGDRPDDEAQTRTSQFATSALSTGDIVGDRFRIEKLVGMGGMGMVYLAHDMQLDIPVALKVLRAELATRSESRERFRRELLLSRQISSPHVVRIHDLARFDEHWLITMDYVDGEGLDRYIDQHGPLPWTEAVAIVRQLAEGLAAAHDRDVIHRDLKPANVLIDSTGNVCISDFGVALSLGSESLTRTGSVVGTPDYLSPEQARAEQADARSDLYSVGLIFHEMLTGKLPFSGATPSEMLAQKMARRQPDLSQLPDDLPPWVKQLCARLLHPVPSHRIQSARKLVSAIDEHSLPANLRTNWIVPLIVMALCLTALAGFWWFAQRQAGPDEGKVAVTAATTQPGASRLAITPFVQAEPEGSDTAVQAVLDALSLHLDAWLRESPTTGVIPPERVLEAMGEARVAAGSAPPDPESLRKSLVAHDLIVPQLQRDKEGYRIVLTLYHDARPPQRWAASANSPAQLSHAYQKAASDLLQTLHVAVPPPRLPGKPEQLAALGKGDASPNANHLDILRALHKSWPQATWIALRLARSLHRAGQDNQAMSVISTTRDLRQGANGRLDLELAALLAELRGNNQNALEIRHTLVKRFPHDPQLQLELAEALGNAGQLDSAIRRLKALSDQDPGNPHVWYMRGKFAILKGDAQRAVDDYLVRALVQFNRSRDTRGQAETTNALGVGYQRLGQIDAARSEYNKALALTQKMDDKHGEASGLRNLAALDWVQGDFDGAASRLHKAQAILEQLDDQQGLADLYNDLGLLAEERGNYASSLEQFRRGLALRQQLDDARGTAESLNNVGFSYYQQGQYDNAQVYWEQASSAFAKLDNQTGMVRSAQSLALLEIARGHWAQARSRLAQTLDTAQQRQMREEQAVSLSYLAKLDMLEGELVNAGNRLDAAELIFRELDDQRGLAEITLQRARLQIILRDYAQADATLTMLQKKSDDLGLEQRVAAELERARLAHLRGKSNKALLGKASRTVKSTGLHTLQVEASLLTAAGDPEAIKKLVSAMAGSTPISLRLRGLEDLLQAQLDTRQYDDATATYAQLRSLLANLTDYVLAWRVHALGCQGFEANGDSMSASQARKRAQQAMERLLKRAPAEARQRLQTAMESRLSSIKQNRGS